MSDEKSPPIDFGRVLKEIEKNASGLFEDLATAVLGEAESLRDGTEFDPVRLPRDLCAHENVQTEWWYYTGHGRTTRGREFGFELVFFKRRTDLDKFSLIPLRFFGNPIYFAHFALTDIEGKKFRYAHRKSSNGWLDAPASASCDHFHLRIGDWSLRESHGAHILRATANDTVFEADLKPVKAPVLNGTARDGVSFKDEGEASRYFSYTRMEMEGDIIWDGRTDHFTGWAWMDREFGTWTPTENQKGWDWFSIQFDDQTELMCYQLRSSTGAISSFSSGSYVDSSGNSTPLARDEFTIEPHDYWRSSKTKTTYPSGWRITVPKLGLDINVLPVMKDQELDTRGTTMVIYWEGACRVTGTRKDDALTGLAYVELVGYDRSHESPNLAYFLMGNQFEFPPRGIFG